MMPIPSVLRHLIEHETARSTGQVCRGCGCRPAPSFEEADDASRKPTTRTRRRSRRRSTPAKTRTKTPALKSAPGATPAGGFPAMPLPDWKGWSDPVRLSEVLKVAQAVDRHLATTRGPKTRGGRPKIPDDLVPRKLKPFFTPTQQVYRVSVPGDDRPTDIGQTGIGVGLRLYQHYTPVDQIQSDQLKRVQYARRGRRRVKTYRDLGNAKLREILKTADPNQVAIQRSVVPGTAADRRWLHHHEIVLQKGEKTRLYDPNTTTFEDDIAA